MDDVDKKIETPREESSMFSFLSSRKSGKSDAVNGAQSSNLDKDADITSFESTGNSGARESAQSTGPYINPASNVNTSNSSSDMLWFLPKFNFTTIILIIASLALLGFNIFTYLGEATDITGSYLRPIIDYIYTKLGYAVTDTAKTTINVGAQGAVLGVDVAAGTLTSAINTSQRLALGGETDPSMTPSVGGAIDNIQIKRAPIKKSVVTSDDSQSVFQQSSSSKKAGWCFVGEDKGVRSCISVAEGDTCISNNIFPSREICMNPSLRE